MAPLKASIQDCSSEDPKHKAENILCTSKFNWLCHKDDTGTMLNITLQLERASRITHINIGNHGSAFIEIKVGKSIWHDRKSYELLLPSATLMSPAECKDWRNTSKVFMFNQASFRGHVAQQKWDRLKIFCRQPFEKEKQFGLSFVEIRGEDKIEKSEEKKRLSVSSIKNGTEQLKSMVEKAIHSSGGFTTGRATMSRTQLCLQNALEKRRNNPNWPTSKLSTSVDLEDGDCLSDLEFDFEEESRPFSISSTPINIKKQPSKLMAKKKSWSDGVLKTRRVSKKFSMEVECFLKEINIDRLDLEHVNVSDLRKRIEKLRGAILNKGEKKVFFEIVGKKINEVNSPKVFDDTSINFAGTGGVNLSEDLTTSPKTSLNEEDRKRISSIRMKRRNTNVTKNTLLYGTDTLGPPNKTSKEDDPFKVEKKAERDSGHVYSKCILLKEKCTFCGKSMSESALKIHASFCQGKSEFENDSQETQDDVCVKKIEKSSTKETVKSNHITVGLSTGNNDMPTAVQRIMMCHSDEIVHDQFDRSQPQQSAESYGSQARCSAGSSENEAQCPICFGRFPSNLIDIHVNYCLDSGEMGSIGNLCF